MSRQERLVKTDRKTQQALWHLAKAEQALRIGAAHVQRLGRTGALPAQQSRAARRALEQTSRELYKLGCHLLGVPPGEPKRGAAEWGWLAGRGKNDKI